MNQREVWDNIAGDWTKNRPNPFPDAVEFLKNKKGLVLDVGRGSGRNFVQIEGKFVGIDFSKRMLQLAENNAKKNNVKAYLATSDALELPFKSDSFDTVVISRTLHCVKWNKRKKFLEEIIRVGKNNAHVFVSVWNKDQPRFANLKKEVYVPWPVKGKEYKRYYYLYSKDELEALMKKFFKNVKVFWGKDKAFKKYPKNIIAIARVAK